MARTTTNSASASPTPAAGDHPRVLIRIFLSRETCKELEFVHRSCAAAGYRPSVLSTSLPHLAATGCGHLLLPWCKGASIGWHSDDNKPYLRQRAFTDVVIYTADSRNVHCVNEL
nr:unnamed protein product [Digitaria exilis]